MIISNNKFWVLIIQKIIVFEIDDLVVKGILFFVFIIMRNIYCIEGKGNIFFIFLFNW